MEYNTSNTWLPTGALTSKCTLWMGFSFTLEWTFESLQFPKNIKKQSKTDKIQIKNIRKNRKT
jgi:hypothetical protein